MDNDFLTTLMLKAKLIEPNTRVHHFENDPIGVNHGFSGLILRIEKIKLENS